MVESIYIPPYEPPDERTPLPINPRPAPSQSLDRISGDPNFRGTNPRGPEQEEGSGADNRRDGRSGTTEERGAGSSGDSGLPISPTGAEGLPPSSTTKGTIFTSADNILKKIAERFNEARENGKVQAWRQFQRDLMDASPYIVPHLIPYKDLVQLCADIEKEIKGSTSQVGKSNEELLAEFLTGGPALGEIAIPGPPADYNAAEELPLTIPVSPEVTNDATNS